MAHYCVDWTTRPPTRRTPLLVLTRGDDHVYTVVPKELKTLEAIARSEFDLGDVDVHFLSPCASLCHGHPARITEHAWEHISPYIGCATVEISPPQGMSPRRERPTTPGGTQGEHIASAKRKARSDAGEGHALLDTPPGEAVRDELDTTMTDHGSDRNSASAPEDDDPDQDPWEEAASTFPPQRSRSRRRVVAEDSDESEREHNVPARSQLAPIASPPKPTQPGNEVKQERQSDYPRAQPGAQSAEPLHRSSRPIKQEKRESGPTPQPSPPYDTQTQTHARLESGENRKLTIRVAHRPSQQESKFTAKGTTRVAKVLAGACKSFGLDASQAVLYLIVSVEDDDGQVENLFPCDKNDTIARAGAERGAESRFLLKMAGEA